MTITVEDLRTAAKVAEEKNYLGTRDMYLKEAEELENTLLGRSYIDELAEIGRAAWISSTYSSSTEYARIITRAVVEKLTEDGHLNLDEPVKVWKRENLELGKAYLDCDGDRVEWRGGQWSYWWEARNRWIAMTTDTFAPYTLVE